MKRNPQILILLESSREYGRGLLRGISKYAIMQGNWSIQLESFFYVDNQKFNKNLYDPLKWLSDGAIIRQCPGICDNMPTEIPIIQACYCCENSEDQSVLITDDVAIGEMAAEHFIERGFKRIGFVGFDDMYWSNKRFEGLKKAANKAGYEVFKFDQSSENDARIWDNEQFTIGEWLKALEKPAAIFACNDDRASQIISACRTEKINIPGDVAILGVDDDQFICMLSNPAISSIELSLEKAGFEAAAHLDEMIANKNTKHKRIVIEPISVRQRASTDAIAIEDEDMSNAIKFIIANSDKPIQVCDVLEETTTSRRCLYDKFNKYLGTSIYSYIKKNRVRRIEQLLADTNLSISQIAYKLGFSGPDHIAQFFKSVNGSNPTEYRERCREE